MSAIGLWGAPMMGMPLFSRPVPVAMGSLIGHLIAGMIVGGIGDLPDRHSGFVGGRAARA